MKKVFVFLIVLIGVGLPIHLIGQAADQEMIHEERLINQSKKSWTVHFNDEVNSGSIMKENIYIMNNRGQTLKAKLDTHPNGKSITITPDAAYQEGMKYYLVIKSNLKSVHNIFLNEKTIVPFKYEKNSKGTTTGSSGSSGSVGSNGSKSSDVAQKNGTSKSKMTSKVQKHSYFVEMMITVDEQIVKVMAGRDELEYKGNNQFLLYKPGLKSGDKVTVKGYSISGKVIESKEVTIP